MEICRKNIEEKGLTPCCTFHEGYVAILPENRLYDAATSILVSQFLPKLEERRQFFQSIAARLRPGGYFITSDLAADTLAPEFKDLLEPWMRTMKLSGVSNQELEMRRAAFSDNPILAAVLAPKILEELIASSGFEAPMQFYQFMTMPAWFARRKVSSKL